MTLESAVPASTLAPVQDALAKYQRHLAEHVSCPELVLLADSSWSNQYYYDFCKVSRVYFNWGVYLHLAEDGHVLYVGVAVSQDKKGPMHECWKVQDRINGNVNLPLDGRRWIVAAVVPALSEWGFLLPALEAFLIAHFQPKFNTDKKHLHLPQ